MSKQKWNARTKRDLIIEVWERLDCESVGRIELEAIVVQWLRGLAMVRSRVRPRLLASLQTKAQSCVIR